MRAPVRAGAPGTVVVMALVLVLVLAGPAPATATAAAAATGSAAGAGTGGVPVGLAALGALLGVLVFGVRQWWARPGRGRR